MADGSEVQSLASALMREQKKVALVQEVSRALSTMGDTDQLLKLIMEKVTELMEADRSTLYLVSEDGGTLTSEVVQGGEVVNIRLTVGEGIAGWVAQTRETLNIPDAYADQRFQPAFDLKSGYRTRSILTVPMAGALGGLVGVLQLINKEGGPFDRGDEELAAALATQAAIAIENTRLYQSLVTQNQELMDTRRDLERRQRELNALYEVEKDMSHALDLDDLLSRILAQAIGLIGWSIAHKTPVIVDDPASDPRHARDIAAESGVTPAHLMVAPLVDGEEVMGAVEIIDQRKTTREGSAWSEVDLKLLVLIASQAASAIGFARQRNEQSKTDRLASIGRMLAGLLHDLKTPMTIISSYGQLMAASDDAAQREAYVEQIQRQFDLMAGMTREVLAFARGDADLVVRKVYMNHYANELATQLGAATAGRNIDFTLDAKYDGIAYFDEQKLMRVFHNLTRNAVEAMPDGGKLTVSVDKLDDQLRWSVQDTGPGIPAELRGRLFELFSTGRKGGTGLGLAIVKKILDDHHGTITVETGSTGTNFVLQLPIQRPHDGD